MARFHKSGHEIVKSGSPIFRVGGAYSLTQQRMKSLGFCHVSGLAIIAAQTDVYVATRMKSLDFGHVVSKHRGLTKNPMKIIECRISIF